jgi:hypothetical protein
MPSSGALIAAELLREGRVTSRSALAPSVVGPQTRRCPNQYVFNENAAMAPSHLLRTISLAVVIALAQAACAAGLGSSSPTATPTNDSLPSEPARTPSAECINPPPGLLTLLNQTDPVACYSDTPITVDAQVVPIGAIDCAPIVPAWLGCGAWVALQPIGARAGAGGFVLAATSGSTPPWMFAAIHPDTNLIASDILGRSLRITGHFDDPAAQTCRQTELVFDEATLPPPDISSCRNLFVLTAFEEL